MSDELIKSLQGEITRLNAVNAKLNEEAKTRRLKNKKLQEQNDQLTEMASSLAEERDRLAAMSEAAPNELQAKIDELQGQIRQRDHRTAFDRLAKESKVREDALEDFWSLSGYKPEADEIDEKSIKAVIDKTLQGRDWLKAAPEPDGSTRRPEMGGQATQFAPGPGSSRGSLPTERGQDDDLIRAFPDPGRLA